MGHTICAEMITELRGADLIVRDIFFEITDVGFFFFEKKKKRRHARSVVFFAKICAFVLLVSTMLGLRSWGDDLNVVLFEFLEDRLPDSDKKVFFFFFSRWPQTVLS